MSAAAEKAFPLFQADVGNDEGTGAWFEVTQDQVNQFADVTHDHQFIHVDPQRAAATPFGGTIAHGFLTLSLIPRLLEGIMVVPEGMHMAVNYGVEGVRFMQPVAVNSRVRLRLALLD